MTQQFIKRIRVENGLVQEVQAEEVVSSGGALVDGDYGDVVVSGGGTVLTIDTGVVTTAKLGGDITTAGKAILDDANAAAQRTTLGLGTAATANVGDFDAAGMAMVVVAAHEADTTAVHGIADTSALVVTTDPRLSDARTPTAHATSHKLAGSDVILLNEFGNPTGSVEFNQQQVLQMRVENRTSDPGSPAVGQVWFRTDL